MPNVNRWALKNDAPSPNPGAGATVGRVQPARSEADMALPSKGAAGQWSPTVVNLAVLILLELVAFAALRYAFRTAHGG